MEPLKVGAFALGYRLEPGTSGLTFVFVNALTGTGAMWEDAIAPALREAGHGTLSFDLPGQPQSPLAAERSLEARDLSRATADLMRELAPVGPIPVGLSIGGLFALQAHLELGMAARGFVLINTLRKADARLAWINDAVLRLGELGGGRLLKDIYGPLLFGVEWLGQNRHTALDTAPYEALKAEAADRKLLLAGCGADWDVAYERVAPPTVVLTGLEDRVFYNADHVQDLAARLPGVVRQDVAQAGHLLPVEAPDAVVAACLSLVGRVG